MTKNNCPTSLALEIVGRWTHAQRTGGGEERRRLRASVKRARRRNARTKEELRLLRLKQRLMRPARLDELTQRASVELAQRIGEEQAVALRGYSLGFGPLAAVPGCRGPSQTG